jgi:hypothetical protein
MLKVDRGESSADGAREGKQFLRPRPPPSHLEFRLILLPLHPARIHASELERLHKRATSRSSYSPPQTLLLHDVIQLVKGANAALRVSLAAPPSSPWACRTPRGRAAAITS